MGHSPLQVRGLFATRSHEWLARMHACPCMCARPHSCKCHGPSLLHVCKRRGHSGTHLHKHHGCSGSHSRASWPHASNGCSCAHPYGPAPPTKPPVLLSLLPPGHQSRKVGELCPSSTWEYKTTHLGDASCLHFGDGEWTKKPGPHIKFQLT